MDFQQIRKYVKGVLTNSFTNKSTLDKLSTSDKGNLLFDGKEINSGGGSNGGKYTETILYDYREDNGGVICYDTTSQTLRDDIENYDLLWLEFVTSAEDLTGNSWNGTCQLALNVNILSNSYNPNHVVYTSYDTRASMFYIKGKEFKTTTKHAGNINGLVKIIGIKFIPDSGSGGGSSSLVIPDYSNLITTVNGNSYTATQNCYVEVYIEASDGREDKYIVNGVMLGRCGASVGIYQGTKGIFLKENDVLNTRQDVNHTIVMNVFGLQAISM